ncbi:SMR family transporter [Brachybacterium sp. J144]|uniref:DMT family transporter n=1 Tax=Brachybacterium sp. J144 TaxID=3116487 RepID=UPI002E7855D8|nr:SMR family transporter [Brachybacterium sp. J144]MEE1651146.1 SMR family transporter [Brachybacterium sp. J144]
MSWIVLIASGMLEAVWARALGVSEGFTKMGPTVLFAVALVLSMVGLSLAMQTISVGTAYAVWVGIGALLTALYPILRGEETLGAARGFLLAVLIGSIVGLKAVA